jgi:hypothetical protein
VVFLSSLGSRANAVERADSSRNAVNRASPDLALLWRPPDALTSLQMSLDSLFDGCDTRR